MFWQKKHIQGGLQTAKCGAPTRKGDGRHLTTGPFEGQSGESNLIV